MHDTLGDYLDAVGSKKQKGFWANADAYTISLLKAWWGDAAREDNDWAYDYLPRLSGPHGTYQTVMGMLDDEVEGYFLLGQNPAVGSAHGRMQRLGMSHLKWLVVRDLNLIESATWWKDGPEIASGELRTEDIETEVFFMPAASHVEKAGSFTQTQRLLQWRHQAVEPPGECQSELAFFYELGKRIRQRLAGSTDERDRPLLDLTWDYPTDEHGDPDGEAVLAEVNGYHVTGGSGRPLSSYTELRADGSTAAGCWIYTGVYANAINQAARRVPRGGPSPSQSEWGWAWPADRRILYNRASADPDGKPWSERKKYIWWDEADGSMGRRRRARLRRPTGRRAADPIPTSAVPTRWPVTTRSSCRPTARAGCSHPRAWSTDRCPRTTNRRSRRSPTRCIRNSRTRRESSSRARTI